MQLIRRIYKNSKSGILVPKDNGGLGLANIKKRMFYRAKVSLISVSCFFGVPIYGQHTADIDSIATKLKNAYSTSPPEMIYLQTSKDIYKTGEDLWFKAYQVDTRNHYLSAGSETLYLQAVNESDSIIWQEKYPLFNGIADGHIYLDEKLRDGSYTLEAYTATSFFDDSCAMNSIRKIEVVKNIANQTAKKTDSCDNFKFETFPEGGNLVSGIYSQVAFKATDGKGNPIDISGNLYENDSLIASFESLHDGMGKLLVTPSENKTYQIRLSNGKEYSLPPIHTQGLSLHLLTQHKDSLEFMVYQNKGASEQTIFLLGQMGGTPCCLGKAIIKDSIKIKIPIKENDFPVQGIAEFTLFNQDENPVAERLVFINPEKELNISAKFDKKIYMVKNKAQLKLRVTDENGKPVQAHLGVSVFDKAYSDQSYPVNIQTHCLLSSQIKGNIHNPYYYFDKKNDNRLETMDLLLMTQGWRRYNWKYVKEENSGSSFFSDNIEGIQTIKNKKFQGSEQMVQAFNAKEQAALIWVDTLGQFSVNPEMMYQLRGGYLYLKPLLAKENGIRLEIEDPFKTINAVRKQKKIYFPFIDTVYVKHTPIDRGPLINQFGTILLGEVIVTAKSHEPRRDKYMGRLDSLAQVNLGPWVCECQTHPHPPYLQNYREGYDHHPHGSYTGKKLLPIQGKTYTLIKYEPKGANGNWILTDKKTIVYQGPEYSDEDLLKMNNLWRIKGYYAEREFYMPDDIEILSSLPDTRNTLLWNPTVITDEKGEATLEFYTSDLNTGFIGRIEGIGNDGLLGVALCEMNVIRTGQIKQLPHE